MAIHSSTIAWKIPWTEEPGRLQSMGSQRVRHDWATSLSLSWCVDIICLYLCLQGVWACMCGYMREVYVNLWALPLYHHPLLWSPWWREGRGVGGTLPLASLPRAWGARRWIKRKHCSESEESISRRKKRLKFYVPRVSQQNKIELVVWSEDLVIWGQWWPWQKLLW